MDAPDSIPFEQAVMGGVVNMVPHDPPQPDKPLPTGDNLAHNYAAAIARVLALEAQLASLGDGFARVCRANSELADAAIDLEWTKLKLADSRRTCAELVTDGNAVTLAESLQRKCAELDQAREDLKREQEGHQYEHDDRIEVQQERDRLRSAREDQMQALGLPDDDHTDIAAEIRRLRDGERGYFHALSNLQEKYAKLGDDFAKVCCTNSDDMARKLNGA